MDVSDVFAANHPVDKSIENKLSKRVYCDKWSTEVKTQLVDAPEEMEVKYKYFDGSTDESVEAETGDQTADRSHSERIKAEPKMEINEAVVKSERSNDSDNTFLEELEVQTTRSDKPHKCIICDYYSETSSGIKDHIMKEHMGNQPFKCGMCNFATEKKRNLRKHMKLHVGVKEYKCDLCEYTCKMPVNLKSHMITHTGKKYKCTLCGYAAAVMSVLKLHMRIHTGEKPFHCSECDYASANHQQLKRHMIWHSGVKPYKCSVCSFATVDNDALKRHILRRHDSLSSAHGLKENSIPKQNQEALETLEV